MTFVISYTNTYILRVTLSINDVISHIKTSSMKTTEQLKYITLHNHTSLLEF